MSLLALHLLTILPPPEIMSHELIPELRVADLIDRARDILIATHADPAANDHHIAFEMARNIESRLRNDYAALASTGSESGEFGDALLRDIDATMQLMAWHLDQLDGLRGVPA